MAVAKRIRIMPNDNAVWIKFDEALSARPLNERADRLADIETRWQIPTRQRKRGFARFG